MLTGRPTPLLWTSLILLFIVACSGSSGRVSDFKKASKVDMAMDSWVGHYQSELIASWGPPTKVASDGKGGSILTYESFKGTWGDDRDSPIVGGVHYPAGRRQEGYVAKRIFYVNDKGVIYSWNWSGL
jgi:hypothetical protein